MNPQQIPLTDDRLEVGPARWSGANNSRTTARRLEGVRLVIERRSAADVGSRWRMPFLRARVR